MHTVSQIAAVLDAPVRGDGARSIAAVAALDQAGERDISVLSSEAYLKEFALTRAGAVLVGKRIKLPASVPTTLIVVDDPELALARVLGMFSPPPCRPAVGVDPMARVDASAVVGPDCRIGPFAVIGQRVRLGAGCVLHPGVCIGDDTTLGDHCELFANVVVRERITIGDRVIIHAGSVLGADGFGYRWNGKEHVKVPQIGTVIVESDVEIGSCVCIDRAKFSVTRIGRGTKIDNLVQIAHNVRIGEHCIIVGQAGLAGSVVLGNRVTLGGQAAVRDHVSIGDNAMAAATAGIIEDVPPGAVVSGIPAFPHRQSLREQAALRRLPDLVVQVRKLQEKLDELTAARKP